MQKRRNNIWLSTLGYMQIRSKCDIAMNHWLVLWLSPMALTVYVFSYFLLDPKLRDAKQIGNIATILPQQRQNTPRKVFQKKVSNKHRGCFRKTFQKGASRKAVLTKLSSNNQENCSRKEWFVLGFLLGHVSAWSAMQRGMGSKAALAKCGWG